MLARHMRNVQGHRWSRKPAIPVRIALSRTSGSGHRWNRKPAHRIHCRLELDLRIEPRRRIGRDKPEELSVSFSRQPIQWIDCFRLKPPDRVWSMGFMADHPADGRRFRLLNVPDDCVRKGPGIGIGPSPPAEPDHRMAGSTAGDKGG